VEQFLKVKGQVTGNENVQMVFAHIFVKTGSIYVKSRQSDQRPILHISLNTFHQRKCFVFLCVIGLIRNIIRKPHVAAAIWPCNYLFYFVIMGEFAVRYVVR